MTRLPELLTVSEVAQALRVDPATVRRWALNGTLPCVRIGVAGYRFRHDDIAARLEPVPADEAIAQHDTA